jgi:hypothetical protein
MQHNFLSLVFIVVLRLAMVFSAAWAAAAVHTRVTVDGQRSLPNSSSQETVCPSGGHP